MYVYAYDYNTIKHKTKKILFSKRCTYIPGIPGYVHLAQISNIYTFLYIKDITCTSRTNKIKTRFNNSSSTLQLSTCKN